MIGLREDSSLGLDGLVAACAHARQGFFGREEAWVAIGCGDDYRIALPCFFGIEARYGEVETSAQTLQSLVR